MIMKMKKNTIAKKEISKIILTNDHFNKKLNYCLMYVLPVELNSAGQVHVKLPGVLVHTSK